MAIVDNSYMSKRWCFTIFYQDGYPLEDIMQEYRSLNWGIYGGAQLESCPTTDKLHIQGFVLFDKNMRASGVKKIHRTAHWEGMKGTLEQSEKYCSKEESRVFGVDPVIWGTKPVGRGTRTDLSEGIDVLKAARGSVKQKLKAVADSNPVLIVKYARGMQMLATLLEDEPDTSGLPEEDQLYIWQRDLLADLRLEPDNRRIIWVYDPIGNMGKSTFVNFCMFKAFKNNSTVLSGAIADMAYAYDGEGIVFFDMARTQADKCDHLYSFAEDLKNRRVFSRKYESRLKFFKTPHVVFFSNSLPDYSKWSADRYHVIHVSDTPQFFAETQVYQNTQ